MNFEPRTVYKLRWFGLLAALLVWPPLPYFAYLAGVSCERYNNGGQSDGLGTFDHLRYGNYPFVFMAIALAVSVIFFIVDLAGFIEYRRNPPYVTDRW